MKNKKRPNLRAPRGAKDGDAKPSVETFITGKEEAAEPEVEKMPWEMGFDNTSTSEKNVNVLLNEHYRESIKKLHTLSPKYNNGKHLMQSLICEGVDKLIAELESDND